MNTGTDRIFQKYLQYLISPILLFSQSDWNFAHWEVGSWGLIPLSLANVMLCFLIKVQKTQFHRVLMGCLLLEWGHHALRKPKDPMERNWGPQPWSGCQLKVSANLPALWVRHLGSKSLILAIPADTVRCRDSCPCWTLLNWISRARIDHCCCFRH